MQFKNNSVCLDQFSKGKKKREHSEKTGKDGEERDRTEERDGAEGRDRAEERDRAAGHSC
jgi:hypothetical protein